MRRKKPSLYDAHEKRILQQSTAFADFLTRKGAIADGEIEDERIRKAKQNAAKKAYHNTEVLLEQYRTIVWVLECTPDELSEELRVHTKNIDELVSRIDFEMTMPQCERRKHDHPSPEFPHMRTAYIAVLCWGISILRSLPTGK